ncbi:MAG: glycine--tRNA ligase [Candidatus Nanoarchaeia archaeon]
MIESKELKDLVTYMANKGFVWGPEPELYGGTSGFYSYGPLGKLLKNNVEEAIRDVFKRNELFEVECPIVMQKKVWEASGHLGGFTDPLIKCSKCQSDFRLDKLIEEFNPDLIVGIVDDAQLLNVVKKNNIKCPNCKGALQNKVIKHDLMMGTKIGVDGEAYNRPETATTTYLSFPRYLDFFRQKLPFGVFQIGKAFRNEISPRQHLMRMREFTQAEGQIFIFPEQKNDFKKYEEVKKKKLPFWTEEAQKQRRKAEIITLQDALKKKLIKSQAYAWTLNLAFELFKNMGIPEERIRMRQHHSDEKAFYADDAWDMEIKLNSFGWYECCGIHDRSDYDLTQHGKHSGNKLVARNEKNEKKVPHILEIAFGTDRPVFALLDIFYDKKSVEEGKTTLRVPQHLAPVKVAVLPLVNKEGLPELAREIQQDLIKDMVAVYDRSASIGKRYLRNDAIGTPYCITVDFDSLEDKDVTLRERDSSRQVRVKIAEIKSTLIKLLKNEMKFAEISS